MGWKTNVGLGALTLATGGATAGFLGASLGTSIAAGAAAGQIGKGLVGLASKDPFEASKKQAGATAARLEQSLTQAALKRLSGRLDPATRAQIARATESSRAEQAQGQADVRRDFTRRGLRGSGLAGAASQRLARQGRLERGAGQANIELASLEAAKASAGGLAASARGREEQQRRLSAERKAQFMGLIQSGLSMGAGAATGQFGGGTAPAPLAGQFSTRNATPSEFANRSVSGDFNPITVPSAGTPSPSVWRKPPRVNPGFQPIPIPLGDALRAGNLG